MGVGLKNKTCSYCDFYEPFASDIFNEYTHWGKCIVDTEYKDIEGEDNICDKFKIREDNDITDFMNRCGVL